MTTAQRVRIYFWLISQIKRYGPIKQATINEHWIVHELSGKCPFDRNTFRNYLNDIEEIFDINIAYDPTRGYYIENPSSLNQGNLQRQLLSNFQNFDFLARFRSLGSLIQTEEIPEGENYLFTIGRALKQHRCLCVTYQKFTDEIPAQFVAFPYCLKAIKQRWYLLASKQDELKLKLFALDRIVSLELLRETFVPDQTVDVSTYFDNYFGIFLGEEQPQTVRLRATPLQAKYLRTLPLHRSQKEVSPLLFRYKLCVTPDFVNELMRHGTGLEVLEPESLREKIKERIEEMREVYAVYMLN